MSGSLRVFFLAVVLACIVNGCGEPNAAVQPSSEPPSAPARATAVAYRARGDRYYNAGDYKRAIADYDQANALDCCTSSTYLQRSISYAILGDFERALSDADQAVRLDLTSAPPLVLRANIQDDLGHSDEAICDYTAAIKLEPNRASTYRERGQAYRRRGDLAAALADYSETIRLNPNDGQAYWLRGIVSALSGERAKAAVDLRAALTLTPSAGDRTGIQADLDALAVTTYTGHFDGTTSQRTSVSIDANRGAVQSYVLRHDIQECGLDNPQVVYLMGDSGLITDGRFSAKMSPRGNMTIAGVFGSGIRAAGIITITCATGDVVLAWEAMKQ
jgi:tetratricopeptide (TPR) repeat protein